MNKKTIYLHIGTHKTGTTSIQKFLNNNFDELQGMGYLYPKSCNFQFAQHRLAFALRKQQDPVKQDYPEFNLEVSELLNEINSSSQDKILISSEVFSLLNEEQIQKLKDAFDNYIVKIIIFIRRQDHMLYSAYNQIIKNFNNSKAFSIQEVIKKPGLVYSQFDYASLINHWEKYFEKQNINVLLYDEKDKSSLQKLLNLVNLENHNLIIPRKPVNEGVSEKTLELLRLGKVNGLNPTELRSLLDVGRRSFPKTKSQKQLFSVEERKIFLGNYEDGNEWIKQSYFAEIDEVDFFSLNDLKDGKKSSNGGQQLVKDDLLKIIIDQMQSNKDASTDENQGHKLKIDNNTFVVYQFGKVASTAIVNSLNELDGVIAYQSHFLGRNVFHASMDRLIDASLDDYTYLHTEGQLLKNVRLNRMINNFKVGRTDKNLVFLSLSRDPVEYMRSVIIQDFESYFERLKVLYPELYNSSNESKFVKSAMKKLVERFIEVITYCGGVDSVNQVKLDEFYNQFPDRDITLKKMERQFIMVLLRPFSWFEGHFSNYLDIKKESMESISDYIFYKDLGWCKTYIIRYEDIHSSLPRLVEELNLGEDFQILKDNVSSSKFFASEISSVFKNARLNEKLYKCSVSKYTQFFGYDK